MLRVLLDFQQDETEFRIEKMPLKNPTSHKPKKNDDISLKRGVRHMESCSTSDILRA